MSEGVYLGEPAARRCAGPIMGEDAANLHPPPAIAQPPLMQLLRFRQRQIEFVFRARRELGDVFILRTGEPVAQVMTGHPDDVRSLFSAEPHLAPSTAGESPLRPILGPDSVLTATGDRHMRQRKLLLPHFHGEAIARYTETINDAVESEIDSWPLGIGFPVAPRCRRSPST